MSRKLLYMVIAIALLIGMVPGVVMAQSTRELPAAPGFVTDWNVLGTVQKWTIPYPAASDWAFTPKDGLNGYSLISGGKAGDMSAEVKAESMGALSVQVTDTEGTTYQGEKKWGKIWETQISKPGATKMTWSEYWKKWSGSGQASDLVIGAFVVQQGVQPVVITNPADGAIVHWYLFNSRLDIAAHNLNRLDDGAVLKAQLDFLLSFYGAEHVWFTSGNVGANDRYTQTISGDSGDIGRTNVSFAADAEEAVRIIALVDYAFPQGVQALVRPEFTSWNFWTQEMEKVPQVRWAGEKIVLEKYWGIEFVEPGNGTYVVHYALEGGSPGTLESLHGLLFNQTNSAYSVWAPIDPDGVSRCILTSEKPGEADVTASLYWYPTDPEGIPIGPGVLLNQHGFVVFFLKFESITLTKVPGERSGHNTGDWIPGNPCIDDPTPAGQLAADLLAKEANVSADDLLRVRVRGWFMGDDQSIRQKEYCDVNGNGILDMYDYVLPEGRWVLPDDWQYLAGPQWQQFRSNYDIMNTPSIPSATSYYTPLGPYYTAAGEVGNFPVIGPYSSLDGNMAVGLPYTSLPGRQFGARDTTVPDGILNWYDCPMPPAKVTFEILSGPGYFRAADKADIYYMWDYGWRYWTNPYYAIEIPAGQEIPPFCNNGGYDWDSWGWSKEPGYGPYWFWRIINRLPFGTPLGATMPDDPAHPTKVQVYTDNHGEAMVYINGDWNLNLPVGPKGFIDIPYMSYVGTSTVKAYADYPYMRKHPVIISNPVYNSWFWGKDIVILVEQMKMADNETPDPTNKKVWVLVSDRDEFAVVGEVIVWQILPGAPAIIYAGAADFKYGYMDGLNGWKDPANKTIATTTTYLPSQAEAHYLTYLFGIAVPAHAYGVSWIIVNAGEGSMAYLKLLLDQSMRPNGYPGEGIIERHARSAGQTIDVLDFSQNGEPNQDPVDPIEYLTAGWNLVSFKGSNQSVSTAINSILSQLVSIWAFDNKTKTWKAYSPSAPTWANDLKQMDVATSYWMEVISDVTWTYS